MTRRFIVPALAVMVVLACTARAFSKRPPSHSVGHVPQFQIRARIIRIGGHSPSQQIFHFRWARQIVSVRGSSWSPWLRLASSGPVTVRMDLKRWRHQSLIRVPLQIGRVVDPTHVKVQVRFVRSRHTFNLDADLFGPHLGIVIWRRKSGGALQAATIAGYNRRYWHAFNAAALPPSERPKHFLIADRFIGADADRLDWEGGISHLAKTGITAMLVPPVAPLRGMLLKNGLQQIALGAGITGGPLGLKSDPAKVQKWSSNFASPYFKAGYKPGDFSLFALADEPGWYFPSVLKTVDASPPLLKTFRNYLKQHHLTPAMLGATGWPAVFPVGHSEVSPSTSLSTRRLFYWTCQFFPWFSAEHLREGTIQLHKAFTPKLKTFSNYNNFAGQYYYQGFRANNPDAASPDAAMETPDWFVSGRMHATDFLWTEDWFGNNRAYQWSYYAAKMRSIAYRNGLDFGGYVIGRAAGKPMDGLLQKILTLVGSGAKGVFYYNFGPEYTFPGNCYSNVPGVVVQLARADRMIARAENLLWPGREPHAQVAILQPRSSEVWDGLHIPHGSRVVGAANTNLNADTLGYMAEVFDEYLALEMSDVPAGFVSEDGLASGALKGYKVLYITEPDIPVAGQRAIEQWVRDGGTLVMTPGAAQGDRYDEPVNILTALSGSPWHLRFYLPNVLKLKPSEMIGKVPVAGGPPQPAAMGKAIASFDDKVPAIQQDDVGKGRVVYYSYFPGLSFARVALNDHLGLRHDAAADALRKLILRPVRMAGVAPPVLVNIPYVETPLLESSTGAAVTLLNWTGQRLPSVRVTVSTPFRVVGAQSVARGRIRLRRKGDVVTFSLPLGAADIVKLRR